MSDFTTVIKTVDELLALRDSSGIITVKSDFRIECDVPWSVGKEISGIKCRGDIDCRGYIDCLGDIKCRGYMDCRGDNFICMGDLFWSHASKPTLPEKTYIKRVLPQPWQRDYFQDRLGMDISRGCYDEICTDVLKQIINLLQNDKWTPTERWMLETLRDSVKPVPEWVNEIHTAKTKLPEVEEGDE